MNFENERKKFTELEMNGENESGWDELNGE